MSKLFENGVARGRTEATLDGVAKSLDSIFDWLHRLPCAEEKAQMAALRASQRYLWALMCLVVAATAGILLLAFVGGK